MAPTVTPTLPRPGYGALLRTPGAWTFLLPGFAARLPFAMVTLSTVLLVRHTTGSYGAAGAVSAVGGAAMALFAPVGGRLTDRFGQRAVLVPSAVAHSAAVLGLTALALAHAPLWALLAAAVPTGACAPQIGPMVRARWAVTLGESPLLATATAFESVTDELTFVLGPLIATALCTSVTPAAGLVAEAALTLAGGLLFAARRGTQPPPSRRRPVGTGPVERHARVEGRRTAHARVSVPAVSTGPGVSAGGPTSAGRVPGVRLLVVAFLGVGAVFGGMQVSLAAFTANLGEPGLNGVLYGVFAAGNMVSGLVCGAVSWRLPPRRRLLTGYVALVLVSSCLWAAGSTPVLAALGLLTGLCVAPAIVNGYTLVESLVAPAVRTEAFTWLTGAVAFGQAAAVTVAGQLEDRAWEGAGFLVPLGGTAAALAVLLTLRSRLAPTGAERGTPGGLGHQEPVTVD
ncbi:MFS transporter [Streptomyces sp. NPDC050560]|uniref:MFS transporter n=1 Tax=Streptomyces sp. NPDC050560 TaxID=3365630 RepID=UPI0037B22853